MANEKRNKRTATKKDKNRKHLSVIISVDQDEITIKALLQQVEKLHPKEIIMILHGSNEQSIEILLNSQFPSHTTIIYPFPLGEELWRSIGAKEATGDVWLFLDGSEMILTEDLSPFVHACYGGADIALRKSNASSVTGTVNLACAFFNHLLEQQQLGVSSMTVLPFAMKKKAASLVGIDQLVVPPLAQAIAIRNGLRVETVPLKWYFDHGGKNVTPSRSRQKEMTCLGDHLEAVLYWSEPIRSDHGKVI